ncbi:PSME3-interacting protein-like [Mya arenaria]|uniref:PSME3-interacting protein-like n=1 Tax=Mya arenaria TaxID=6604 RepID=UPI0022E0CDBB|nr:PSME3-interacting protein-like [Mya arenaria]XP_052819018.1 PSME3-interacting protein-like [Mya arenaria]
MSFSASSISGLGVKKFESQTEVDEKKRLRQEEWEKVRKPDDPEVFPEEPVDNRCLYDKLEEQRLKKQEEFDEKVAFRNQVRRLDEDETQFLDFCTERQQDIKDERRLEEQRIISEMKDSRVVKVEEKEAVNKTEEKKPRPQTAQASKKSQLSLLAGAVKRKSTEETSPTKKVKLDGKTEPVADNTSLSSSPKPQPVVTSKNGGVAKVVAVLPVALAGLTDYADSSDSLSSSSDSEEDFSLSGRNIAMQAMQAVKQHVKQQQHQ